MSALAALAREGLHAVRSASMLALATTSTSSPARPKPRVGGSSSPRAFSRRRISRQARALHRRTTTRARRCVVGSRRYLSPEPLLQRPNWVKGQLETGHQVPAYAYARNNPVAYVDPDGRFAGAWRFFAQMLLPPFLGGAAAGAVMSQLPQTPQMSLPAPGPGDETGPGPQPSQPSSPAGPSCTPEGTKVQRCVKDYRDGIKVCQDMLVGSGWARGAARVACQTCLQGRLNVCLGASSPDPAAEAHCKSIGM
jgi:hypothetical protein